MAARRTDIFQHPEVLAYSDRDGLTFVLTLRTQGFAAVRGQRDNRHAGGAKHGGSVELKQFTCPDIAKEVIYTAIHRMRLVECEKLRLRIMSIACASGPVYLCSGDTENVTVGPRAKNQSVFASRNGTRVVGLMAQPIQWSRNPELWTFRAKRLKLHASIEQSRSTRLLNEREYIEREYQRLRLRWGQLVEDGRFAKARNDQRAMQRLAVQIAAFYRDIGTVESRVDSVLDQVAAFNKPLRTG